jgi:hypothetical protein
VQLHLRPFKLPRGEAADMEVMPFRFEPSQGGRKLDLKLQFVLSDGPIRIPRRHAEAGAAPRAVRFLGRQFPAEDCSSSLLAKPEFIWHSVDPNRGGSLSRAEHGRHQALRGHVVTSHSPCDAL